MTSDPDPRNARATVPGGTKHATLAVLAEAHKAGADLIVAGACPLRLSQLPVLRKIGFRQSDQPLSAYWKLSQDPCAINEIAVAPDRVVVVRMNETAHLRIQV